MGYATIKVVLIPLKASEMPEKRPELTAEEIVIIRESLGLTQAKAGTLLGGGPSAYAKYEAGAVKPAAAAANLLRLLKAHPEALATLLGAESPAIVPKASAISPFEVNSKHIKDLPRENLPELLRRLLIAEAEAHNLPAPYIHVPEDANVADGGEDGQIMWKGGPDRTPFLPSRRCQFQLKSGPVQPAQAGREVLDKDGAVKGMVRQFLKDGGHYIMLCARPYPQQAIETRKEKIRAALHEAGLPIARGRILFHDAAQIARWTNCYPPIAKWVLEKAEPGIPGPFRTWAHWAKRAEPWIEDARLSEFQTRLLEQAAQPCSITRVVGPYGIGKSRLTLRALDPIDADSSISNLVLYADEFETDPYAIGAVIQKLADAGTRAIAVVNHCSPERHRILENMALCTGSQLSLVTIDDEISGMSSGTLELLQIQPPATTVIEALIDRISPRLPREDRRRLVQFSARIPGIAVLVAHAWRKRPLTQAADDSLVNAVVLGCHPREPDLLRKTAALLAIFGKVEPESESGDELDTIAPLGRNLTADDLRAAMEDLAARKVIRRRGRLIHFPFSPVAARLAERQWCEWPRSKWDGILGGGIGTGLSLRAARRLARLNDTDIAPKVVAHACRTDGPLDGILRDTSSPQVNMLTSLAETNAEAVAEFLERSLDQLASGSEIRDSAGISLALSRVAFRSDTFEDGARLLLRLAARRGRSMNGIARGRFVNLFPLCEGSTAADGEARLGFLDEAMGANRPEEQSILIDALIKGMQTRHFMRVVGDESHGSRPALIPWFPDTHQEARKYLSGCIERLVSFAERDDDTGRVARSKFSEQLRDLLYYGVVDAVEAAINRVCRVAGGWPEAIENLSLFLRHDTREEDRNLIDRVRKLLEQLQPQDMESRGRFLITHMPGDYPADQELTLEERNRVQVEEIEKLAAAFAGQPETLMRFLPEISRGQQRMAFEFGRELARAADSPPDWLEPVAEAVADAPEKERNLDFLCGYLGALVKDRPSAVKNFKQRAVRSPELAPALPLICQSCGIEPADISLALDALEAGRLPPDRLLPWKYSKKFRAIPETAAVPLFDWLLSSDKPEAFHAGVCLLEPYACEKPENLDKLRPQIRFLAENAVRHKSFLDRELLNYHFERIMRKALENGRMDPGARAVAVALARGLVHMNEWGEGDPTRSVLPLLLSNFTEIVWPMLGQAIVANPDRSDRFRCALGNRLVVSSTEPPPPPPILGLPEKTLFEWCHEHPDCAPAFAAGVVPVLATNQGDSSDRTLHPVLSRLIDEFGEQSDMQKAIIRNIHRHCLTGPGPSDQRNKFFLALMGPLRDRHPKGPVRRWARNTLRSLREQAEVA